MLKLFRASSLADIMTDPKGKDEILSVGAKSAVTKMAKEFIYGYTETVSSKYMEKGIRVEDDSIKLLNSVLFTDFQKNTERRNNEWITGEADIVDSDSIIDVKSSWSLGTFPVLASEGADKKYEWQGRAYMMLWDKPKFKIAYCMVSTPDDLIGYEQKSMHQVDGIERDLRVTIVSYERDLALEEKIKIKVNAARAYLEEIIEQITKEHTHG